MTAPLAGKLARGVCALVLAVRRSRRRPTSSARPISNCAKSARPLRRPCGRCPRRAMRGLR
jgi:hypothetical protein